MPEGRDSPLFVGVLASLIAGGLIWWSQERLTYSTFPAVGFFQPQAVALLADSIPYQNEDEFILESWKIAGQGIPYEPIGSDLYFSDSEVQCLSCFTAAEAIRRRKGNCVAKSSLLVSLLANRIPSERLRMMMGGVANDGIGGHAWVNVYRNGDWYLLEATRGPWEQPWVPASALSSIYMPSVVISPNEFYCNDPDLCLSMAKCNCGEVIRQRFGGL